MNRKGRKEIITIRNFAFFVSLVIKKMTEDETSKIIIGAAIKVHKTLGQGLLESVYEICLFKELRDLGLNVLRQVSVPVVYGGEKLDTGFRIDLLVENKVIVELKAVESLNDIYLAQVLTYLKLSDKKIRLAN